jgi:hypothetical protein
MIIMVDGTIYAVPFYKEIEWPVTVPNVIWSDISLFDYLGILIDNKYQLVGSYFKDLCQVIISFWNNV